MTRCFIIVSLVFHATFIFSQEQLKHEKTIYTDQDGNLYWNKSLPVRIWISVGENSEKILLTSKKQKQYVNPYYFDTEGENFFRTRWAVDTTTKKPIQPQIEVLWPVMTDGTAPTTNIIIGKSGKHLKGNNTYYGNNMSIEFKTNDNISGVKATYISIDGKPYTEYKGNIDFEKEAEYKIKYYSVDNVGNVETPKEFTFSTDLESPKTFHTIVGINLEGNVISANTKIYLKSDDNLTGVNKTYYQIDDGDYKVYYGKDLPLTALKNGYHVLKYYSVDKVGNKENETTLKFYLDKQAPILTSDVIGDKFVVKNVVYFSGNTKLKLTAVDNKSGIKNIMFSINDTEFEVYDRDGKHSAGITLPTKKGIHTIRYFAVDNVDNNTSMTKNQFNKYEKYKHRIERIYVDLSGPDIKNTFIGDVFRTRDTIFINDKTKIKLTGYDKESGLGRLSYNKEGSQEETTYTKPFTIKEKGFHIYHFFGYDNVNNRNINSFNIYVDVDPPVIGYKFSIEPIGKIKELDVYPSYVQLFLTATDETVGTQSVYYSKNGSGYFPYNKPISNFVIGKKNTIKIKAVDKLKNTSEKEFEFYIQD